MSPREAQASPNPSDSTPILRVTDLSKRYGTREAVKGISFEVHRGEIVALLGVNGAGKTTTLSMVMGVLKPSGGEVRIGGHDVFADRERALARTGFAAVYAPLPGNLSVRQNLKFFGHLFDVTPLDARVEEALASLHLGRFAETKCGVLSSGEQTRAALAKAMLHRPELLLLDEPTASLDPATAQDIRKMLRASVEGGEMGVLWTSHNMAEVEEVADRVLFLADGKLLLSGAPKQLVADSQHASLEALFVAIARGGKI